MVSQGLYRDNNKVKVFQNDYDTKALVSDGRYFTTVVRSNMDLAKKMLSIHITRVRGKSI